MKFTILIILMSTSDEACQTYFPTYRIYLNDADGICKELYDPLRPIQSTPKVKRRISV